MMNTTTSNEPPRVRSTSRAVLGERGFALPPRRAAEHEERFAVALAVLDVAPCDGEVEAIDVVRPRTRAECVDGARPCPWVGCRHHLAINVTSAGSLQIVEDLDLENHADTCSLDVGDRGEHTLDAVGQLLNVTRERVRQIERRALGGAAAAVRSRRIRKDVLPFAPDRGGREAS